MVRRPRFVFQCQNSLAPTRGTFLDFKLLWQLDSRIMQYALSSTQLPAVAHLVREFERLPPLPESPFTFPHIPKAPMGDRSFFYFFYSYFMHLYTLER